MLSITAPLFAPENECRFLTDILQGDDFFALSGSLEDDLVVFGEGAIAALGVSNSQHRPQAQTSSILFVHEV